MKRAFAITMLTLVAFSSCMTVPESVYQSNAPEVRGERAISSAIDLVSEVELRGAVLGVFFAKEVYRMGTAENLLFTWRPRAVLGHQSGPRITDYGLSATASMSAAQARDFLSAIEEYLAKDPEMIAPTQKFNFELYSGTLDMAAGNEQYRPFQELTFIVVCSVTNAGKSFKTVFPGSYAMMSGVRRTQYTTFDLTTEQVEKFRDAVKAALTKASPSGVTPADSAARSGT